MISIIHFLLLFIRAKFKIINTDSSMVKDPPFVGDFFQYHLEDSMPYLTIDVFI